MARLAESYAAGSSGHLAHSGQIAKRLNNQWHDVKADYSATGDGSTDDYSVIASAFTAVSSAGYGTVYFPDGVYRHSDSFTVPANCLVVLSPGATIKPNTTLTIKPVFLVDGVDNVTIEGGTLDGSKSTNTNKRTNGIEVKGSTNVSVRNVVIKDFPGQDSTGINQGDGVLIARNSGGTVPSDIVVEGCTITGCVRQGISLIAGTKVRILHNKIMNITGSSPGAGIDVEPDNSTLDLVNDVLIQGNAIDDVESGIIVTTAVQVETSVTIDANHIRNARGGASGGHGVRLLDGQGDRITNNTIEECDSDGIYVAGASYAEVIGNTVRNRTTARQASTYPIHLAGTGAFVVANNGVEVTATSDSHGIVADTSAQIGTISGNVVLMGGQNRNAIGLFDTLDIAVTGNMLYNSGATGIGINVDYSAANASGHVITGNRVVGFATGVLLDTTSSYNNVSANGLRGNTTPITNNGSNNVVDGTNVV